MDKIEQTLNRHLPIRHQFQEPIKARRSKKPLTFANLITEDEASKHYGFIYLAMVNGQRNCIIQKTGGPILVAPNMSRTILKKALQ